MCFPPLSGRNFKLDIPASHTGAFPFNELDGMKWKWLQKAGESNGTLLKSEKRNGHLVTIPFDKLNYPMIL
jgi:hypothetical protein